MEIIEIKWSEREATFIAPDGQKATSEILEGVGYDYVTTPDGQTWLLNEVDIIMIVEHHKTERLEWYPEDLD